jgi:Tol biopolymer transport system component
VRPSAGAGGEIRGPRSQARLLGLAGLALVAAACGGRPSELDVPLQDVFSVASDGSGLRNLTRSPHANETHVSISPDGSRIAFVRRGLLVVTDADGGGPRDLAPLALGPELVAPPSWSPDGRRLAYTNAVGCHEVVCRTWQVWTVDIATGARRRIANDGMNPSWSPDGSRLAYAGRLITSFTARGYFTYRTHVVVVDLRTGRERDLGRGAWPAWAPHGERIAFLRGMRLLVGRADGRRAQAVATDVVSAASWPPTGEKLLFTRDYDDAVVTSADGQHLRRVGDFGALAAWSPDGRSVVGARFVATRDEISARHDLLVVPLDGTPKRIVSGVPSSRMEAPVWTRRGSIVFAAGLL